MRQNIVERMIHWVGSARNWEQYDIRLRTWLVVAVLIGHIGLITALQVYRINKERKPHLEWECWKRTQAEPLSKEGK